MGVLIYLSSDPCISSVIALLSQDRYQFTAVTMLLDYLSDSPVAPLQARLVEVPEPYCAEISQSVYENSETCVGFLFSGVPTEQLSLLESKCVTHTHTHMHTHTHTHMHARTHTHAHMHMHTRTHTRTCTHAHTRAHARTHTHTHAHAHTHMHMHTHTHTHTHMHTRIHVYTSGVLANLSCLCLCK